MRGWSTRPARPSPTRSDSAPGTGAPAPSSPGRVGRHARRSQRPVKEPGKLQRPRASPNRLRPPERELAGRPPVRGHDGDSSAKEVPDDTVHQDAAVNGAPSASDGCGHARRGDGARFARQYRGSRDNQRAGHAQPGRHEPGGRLHRHGPQRGFQQRDKRQHDRRPQRCRNRAVDHSDDDVQPRQLHLLVSPGDMHRGEPRGWPGVVGERQPPRRTTSARTLRQDLPRHS